MIGAILFGLCVVYVLWLGIGYPRVIRALARGKELAEGGTLPPITVVVPAFNEERNIVAKVEDVFRQKYPIDDLTLFVVDNGSTDHTAEYAERAGAIVLHAPRGKISAINMACAQSESNIIVVTDADTTLEPGALQHLARAFTDETIGAVGGWAEVSGGPQWWVPSKVAYHRMDWELRTAEGLVDSCISLDGKLMAWNLAVLAGLPGKAEVDDLVLVLELRKLGYRSVIERRAVVREQGADTWQVELEQIRRRAAISLPPIGRYMGLMFERAPGLYGRLIFPTRRFLAIFMPFMLLYAWLYVLALDWRVWAACTAAGVAGIVWKRAYFPLLQQVGILLAWVDFMTGRVAPAAAWERSD